jgi:hypothetical protein
MGEVRDISDHRFQGNATGTALLLQTPTEAGVKNLWRVTVNPALIRERHSTTISDWPILMLRRCASKRVARNSPFSYFDMVKRAV